MNPLLTRRALPAYLYHLRQTAGVLPDPDPKANDFARWIKEFSSPGEGRGPSADNFVSNEDSYTRIANQIAAEVPRDGAYLGVGPDQNFTMIAHAKPQYAFVIDYRRRNLRLHLLHKALMTTAPDRVAYLTRLTARRIPNLWDPKNLDPLLEAFRTQPMDRALLTAAQADVRNILHPLGVLQEREWSDLKTIQAKLAGPGISARFLALKMYPSLADQIRKPAHFLADERTYQSVRRLQLEHRIIPLVGDYAQDDPAQTPDTFARLGDWLRARKLTVTLLYISDVEYFLLQKPETRFSAYLRNVNQLPWHPQARIARTSTRFLPHHPARHPQDNSTTVLIPAAAFLADARAGKIRTVDDLFRV